jgi:hypothetical protein
VQKGWMGAVSGRDGIGYRYSQIGVQQYGVAGGVTGAQRGGVEQAAQGVWEGREKYLESSLADLYDSLSMPEALVRAQRSLEAAVDTCYRKEKLGVTILNR